METSFATCGQTILKPWVLHLKTSILTTLFSRVVSCVREIFDSCTNILFGVLCEPLDYDEVACVCSKLKLGVTGLCIDYERIRFAGPPVWRLLFELYQNFYANDSVCGSLKTGHSAFI